ncbi:hypothetical protein ACH5RR_030367 [Cinchona calisaya]|uniref:Uncharacterized protein n=1 Tax=Cinchona calisaya TaxID=153742 RepID=A0ABD2YUD4_9GENT
MRRGSSQSPYGGRGGRPPVISRGGRNLYNSDISGLSGYGSLSTSNINLGNIPKDHPLYGQLQEYLLQQHKGNTYASVTENESESDSKSYYMRQEKEIIFLLDEKDCQWQDQPWKIIQRYLTDKVMFPGESYKTRTYYEKILINSESVDIQHFQSPMATTVIYNFSKIIFKKIISSEEWGISTLTENNVLLKNNNRFLILIGIIFKVFIKLFIMRIPNTSILGLLNFVRIYYLRIFPIGLSIGGLLMDPQ